MSGSDDGDYEVGYGRPPKATQFQKGRSGNPKGRPRGSRNVSTLVQQAMGEMVAINQNGRRRKVSKLEAAFIQQANKAAGGDLKAVQLMVGLLDAGEARDRSEAAGQLDPTARDSRDREVLAALKARLAAIGNG